MNVLLLLLFLFGGGWASASVHTVQSPFSAATHWVHSGAATVLRDRVRLTALNERSAAGQLAHTLRNAHTAWQATARVQVSGDASVGADGMALWFTTVLPAELAAAADEAQALLFGCPERFEGVGVVVDTYDNGRHGSFPVAMLVWNDGTQRITQAAAHHVDGERHAFELGACALDVRNSGAAQLRLTYRHDRTLLLEVRAGAEAAFRECAHARLELPPTAFFAFTAASGDLTDNHDVLSFEFVPLDDRAADADAQPPALADAVFDIVRQLSELRRVALHSAPPVVDLGAVERAVATLVDNVRADLRASEQRWHDLVRNSLQPPSPRVAEAAPPPPCEPSASWLQIGTFALALFLAGAQVVNWIRESEQRKAKMF